MAAQPAVLFLEDYIHERGVASRDVTPRIFHDYLVHVDPDHRHHWMWRYYYNLCRYWAIDTPLSTSYAALRRLRRQQSPLPVPL